MNKTYIVIIVAVLLLAGLWFWSSKQPAAPVATDNNTVTSGTDTTASINSDLDKVNVEDADFQAVDSDLNSL